MYLTDWKMSYGEYKNLVCSVPCSMYSVLLEKGIIDDPFYGLNELELTELSGKDCIFECEFTVDEQILNKEYIDLIFLGIDTICSVDLNGQKIADVKNMHRGYSFDVKDIIKKGNNKICLKFSSPLEYFKMMENKHHLYMNSDTVAGASHLRKAFYMSGWDWGPTLPDMGIFRPVMLDAYDTDEIENIFVKQKHGDGKVILDIDVETRKDSSSDIYVVIDNREAKLDENNKGRIEIDNPKLWWVRGYGEQNLYEVSARIEKDGQVIDEKTQKIGLRTLTVSTEKDSIGSEFCFVINGVKIFAMGANYIPQDNLLSRINPERTRKLIDTAMDANFNCLRVWGGGYYPEDVFYDICDELGIVVWQDFMVACANIWLNKDMREEFVAEAEYNVKRLRHHASLGLLCGNNEMEVAVLEWSDVEKSQLVKEDYIELYERIFPEIVNRLAPDVFYWQASPSSGGGFVEPNCETMGDVHYWAVWHDSRPFTDYRKYKFRFCSEYGFESYPSIKTVKEFCEDEDLNCFSRVMENHQKCKSGNMKILMYLASRYLYPKNFESLVYASQLMQADAIKYGVEHFRRNRGCCMGSLYWQFNDCWPVASWSSIDSNLRYKALHYAARKFYAPVAMGLFFEDDEMAVNISNETMADFEGKLKVFRCDSSFDIKESYAEEISVDALKSKDVFKKVIKTDNKYNEFLYAELYDKYGKLIMRQTEMFSEPKHFEWKKPDISVNIKDYDDGVLIEVSSDTFAKGVCIDFENTDLVLSDNFFDLISEEKYTVYGKTSKSADELMNEIKIMTVYDIGK